METYRTLKDISMGQNCAVALGFFDGVHLGHRAVLGAAREIEGLLPVAFTFSTARRAPGAKAEGRIYPDGQRAALLFSCGARAVVMPPFEEIADMGAEEFAALLCGPLRAKRVCCGEDYRFSRGAAADAGRLRALCAALGAQTVLVPPVVAAGGRVSSTRIKALLRAGDIRGANLLLGTRYYIESAVEPGRRIGSRVLGFPTLNQSFMGATPPRYGVYASLARVGGALCPAITNVGVKPTVGEGLAPGAETYLLGYEGNLYGARVRVELFDFLRPEQKFASFEALKQQIAKDCQQASRLCAAELAGV